MPLFFYDYWYVILVVPMIIFSLIMSANVKGTYSKYKTVRNRSGITGAEAARRILLENGITDVRIEVCGGELTDHYNPRTNVVSLPPTFSIQRPSPQSALPPMRSDTSASIIRDMRPSK